MNQDDIRALIRGVAPVVQGLVDEAVAPLLGQIAALERQLAAYAGAQPALSTIELSMRRLIDESRPKVEDLLAQFTRQAEAAAKLAATSAVAALPPPAAGKDADPELVRHLVADAVAALPPPAAGKDADPELVRQLVAEAVAALPPPADGKDADPELVRQLVADAVAALPPPADGKDADPELVRQLLADAVAALPPPADGKDADPAAIERQVRAVFAELAPTLKGEPGRDVTIDEVQDYIRGELATWPRPQDGKSVDPDDVAALVKSAVEALPPPKDGAGVAGALIGHDGQLVLTLTNGEVRQLGQVVGRDADPEEVRRQVAAAVEAIPRPRDGVDGFGLEDLSIEQKDEGRIVELRFQRGELQKTFELEFPVLIDRGVWREGATHAKGDVVTWGGGLWIAQKGATTKPGEGDDWRLAVRRGRDGKDLTPPGKPNLDPIKVGLPSKSGAA
jgi:hypothetical protein